MKWYLVSVFFLTACGAAQAPCNCPVAPSASAERLPVEPRASSAANGPSKETRTSEVIRSVIKQHRQNVRSCYEAALKRSPGLRGKLTVHFLIAPSGAVSSAEFNTQRSTLTDAALVKCALAAVKKIPFPRSSRGFESNVNYPFDFKP